MPVELDFETKYRTEADPWGIGAADSDRYERYRQLVLNHARDTSSIIDIGAGLGAFLARLAPAFERAVGVDVSPTAVNRGRELHPELEFHVGSADALDAIPSVAGPWGVIVFSDVINYFEDRVKARILGWIADHLAPDGIALVAAWSPGGRYLDVAELREFVAKRLAIEQEVGFATGHVAFITKRRTFNVVISVDYETWQPIPQGKAIDWGRDVFQPASRLLALAGELGVPVTLFAEIGEYLWLREHDPGIADRMAEQWRAAVAAGHDVQLHLHPAWLPESGARRDGEDWWWDPDRAHLDRHPGDLGALFARCRDELEGLLRPVDPDYRVRCFRAGAYSVQPSERIFDGLRAAGIAADSSVWLGGVSSERGYDFSQAYSSRLPYWASPFDMALRAVPSERAIVELPIWTPRPGDRWSLDGPAATFAAALRGHMASAVDRVPPVARRRLLRRATAIANRLLWGRLSFVWKVLARAAPRRVLHLLAPPSAPVSIANEYFVMIGHTKGDHDFDAIADALRRMRQDSRLSFVRMRDAVDRAIRDLARGARVTASDEARFQVSRDFDDVMGSERNVEASRALRALIPLDREAILDLGCGAGYWSAAIADERPWTRVTGVDIGEPFLEKARATYGSDRVAFVKGDFAALPLPDASVDCVYAGNTLEHAFDLQRTLAEVHRVLTPGGYVVAAIPADGLNPSVEVDDHTWKATPRDVARRFTAAGFEAIELRTVDVLRSLRGRPYPAAKDVLVLVRARKQPPGSAEPEIKEITDWVYRHLDPTRSHRGEGPLEILRDGHAWCWGYASVLEAIARERGFVTRHISMLAVGHERGRGPDKRETHEVVEIVGSDGRLFVADAMANRVFPCGIEELLARPEIAARRQPPDQRYADRRYDLYDTAYWYSRVQTYTVAGVTRSIARPVST